MRATARIVLAALFVLAFAACPKSPRQLCDGSARVGCKQLKRCDPEIFDRLFDSVTDCVEDWNRLVNCDDLTREDVCADPDDYEPFTAGECLRKSGSRDCDDQATPAACDQICG